MTRFARSLCTIVILIVSTMISGAGGQLATAKDCGEPRPKAYRDGIFMYRNNRFFEARTLLRKARDICDENDGRFVLVEGSPIKAEAYVPDFFLGAALVKETPGDVEICEEAKEHWDQIDWKIVMRGEPRKSKALIDSEFRKLLRNCDELIDRAQLDIRQDDHREVAIASEKAIIEKQMSNPDSKSCQASRLPVNPQQN